jgi:2-hydroxy-6-oxonona-2,4-dienedioate hydrolase
MADDVLGTCESARYTAAHMPHARFIGYPSGGHLWVGHPQEAIAAIEAFLKAREA